MEKKFSAETIFSAISRVVNRVFTQSSVMGLMLFITTILTSCSGEFNNPHPAQASSLMGSMNKAQGHGYATIDVEAHATDANGNPISAEAHVKYQTVDVEVENEEELGLPVILTANPDGSFTTNNGNVITREESHSANGVTMNVAGGFPQEGSLGERTDEGDQIRQIVFAKISDEAFATASLPEKFDKDWRDSTISVVEYHRIWKKTAPVEISYRKTLVLDFEDALKKNKAYGDMLVEKMQGENVLSTWCHYDIMAKWGEFDPQVSAQYVTSFEFTSHDVAGESKELDADLPGLGDGGCFTRKNVRHTAETFEVQFPNTADTNGNTVRPIRGQIDVWVYTYTFENPEDKHKETFEVEFEVKSVKSEVSGNVYERIIEVRINGEVVDTQNGKVELILG